MVKPWLLGLTLFMIYIVTPKIFSKIGVRELNTPEEIYNKAIAYSKVRCLANYTRASALMKRIPDYQDAAEIAEKYDEYICDRRANKADVGRILMILLAVVVALLAIIPPIMEATSSRTQNQYIVYFKNEDGTYYASCNSYSVKNVEIASAYGGKTVVRIASNAFLPRDHPFAAGHPQF